MQMAKLERLARNGSGKENFVAKCAGIEKSPREASAANSAGPDLKTVFSIQISSMFKTYKLQVIPYVKRKALTGVHMVFSGVVPTQIPMERSKPFLLARSLGATVSNKVV